jgi:chorismate dehydratase
MQVIAREVRATQVRQAVRVGCVSYLNAKPLIYGLESADNVSLSLDIPSKLLGGLRENRFDVALLPIIDYQRLDNLRLIVGSGIGCDGPTLTVRIFSHVPVDQIQTLACDVHSHTSVALARVILSERYNRRPVFVDLDHVHEAPLAEARLLIGDKVVCEEPPGFEYQVDLGEAWKQMTGLPFVFAAWIARAEVDLGDLPVQLESAKRRGMQHLPEIVQQHASPRGWPADLAMRYMTEFLKYDIGERQLQAIRLFHQLAAKHGMIAAPTRDLVLVD